MLSDLKIYKVKPWCLVYASYIYESVVVVPWKSCSEKFQKIHIKFPATESGFCKVAFL